MVVRQVTLSLLVKHLRGFGIERDQGMNFVDRIVIMYASPMLQHPSITVHPPILQQGWITIVLV